MGRLGINVLQLMQLDSLNSTNFGFGVSLINVLRNALLTEDSRSLLDEGGRYLLRE